MNDSASTALPPSTNRNIKLTVLGLVILIAIVVAGFVNKITQPRVMTDSELKINSAYMFETPRALPPFALIDHNAQVFDKARLEGRWTMVFFGFTFCPDICPTTMAQLAQLMEKLDGLPEADTQVVLVSVDPARDTPEQLASYVPYFDPDFVGVTGEFMDIHRFATALNTPFRKVPGQDPENYLIDHSANVVLINPYGDYHGFFKAPLDLAKLKVTYRSVRAVWDLY